MIKEKYIERVNETTIGVVSSKIAGIRKKDIKKKGVRVYKDGFVGVSGGIGNLDEQELENQALDNLSDKIPYPCEVEKNNKEEYINSNEIISEESFKDEVEEVLSIVKKENPNFMFFDKVKLVNKQFRLVNDQGLDLYHDDRYIDMQLLIRHENSPLMFDGGVGYIGKRYDRKMFVKDCNDTCNTLMNHVDIPRESKMPVIFLSSEDVIFKKFYHELNGILFGSESSMFSDKMGEKIFSEKLTLEQSRNPEDELAIVTGPGLIPFFDAEGKVNANYRYPLIEKGRIITPYTDKKTSRQFNLPYTGSAIGGYDDIPRIGCERLRIKETGETIKELLGGDKGIIAIVAMGGDFTSDGGFATPVQYSLYFDGEKILGVLPQIQVSSNIYAMFGKDYRGTSIDSCMPLVDARCVVIDMKVSKLNL